MTGYAIPFFGVSRQYKNLREEILDTTDSVLQTGQVMSGEYTSQFEQWLCERNQSKYAITCHSGTQALEIIASYVATSPHLLHPLTAFLPSISFRATANAMIRSGWDLHFVDVDSHGEYNRLQTPDLVTYHAVVSVGLYGLYPTLPRSWVLSNTNPVNNMSLRNGPVIIEDAAQHWLAGPPLGNRAISFDPTKNLGNYGNGGAVVTNDPELYAYAQGWTKNSPGPDVAGTNSRMSEVDCAQLLVKSKYIDQWQKRRRDIANYWIKKFSNNANIRCLVTNENIKNHALHKFVISVNVDRNKLAENLKTAGIETKIHYEQPLNEIYSQYPGPGLLSTASAFCRTVLSLPMYPELTDSEVEYISQQVLRYAD